MSLFCLILAFEINLVQQLKWRAINITFRDNVNNASAQKKEAIWIFCEVINILSVQAWKPEWSVYSNDVKIKISYTLSQMWAEIFAAGDVRQFMRKMYTVD